MRLVLNILGFLALTAVFVGSVAIESSDAHEMMWVKQFGGTAGAEELAHAVDADGSVYIAGRGALTPEPGEIFIQKYDANGNELWTREFGDFNPAYIEPKLCIGPHGYVYVVATGCPTYPFNEQYSFIRKYDTQGNEIWTKELEQGGSNYIPTCSGVCAEHSGVYLAMLAHYDHFQHAEIRKLDLNGNELWRRSTPRASVGSVCADGSGVYLCGGIRTGSWPNVNFQAYVSKYEHRGDELWTRQFGSLEDDYASTITTDLAGIYVAGWRSISNSGDIDAFLCKYDAEGNELWTQELATPHDDWIFGISADPSGIYVAGATEGTLPGEVNLGREDAFVRKYDSGGIEIWTHQFGTSSDDRANAASVDLGNVYVVGFQGGPHGPVGSPDGFVHKYDAEGNGLWTREIASEYPADDAATAVVVGEDIYIVGHTDGFFTGQISVGDYDGFVRKCDAGGSELWTRQFGHLHGTIPRGIAIDASGVYVAGATNLPYLVTCHELGFVRKYDPDGNESWSEVFAKSWGRTRVWDIAIDGSGVYVTGDIFGTLPGQTHAGYHDAFVRKYDFDGNELWTRQFGTNQTDLGRGISVDASGVYAVGSTRGFFPGQTGAGNYDAFIRKYDLDGNELWTRQFGTSVSDGAYKVSVDATGVFLTGPTDGTLPGQIASGGTDVYVRKYDADGNEIWTRQFGTPAWDHPLRICADVLGIYVAGATDGTLPGQAGAGDRDGFVCKYDTEGAAVWSHQFGTPAADHAYGVSVDPVGVFVVGEAVGTFPGNTQTIGSDAFVARFTHDANTPPGEDIAVLPVDKTTGTSPVTLTFPTVNYPGSVSLTTSETGPTLPAGFRLGNPAIYYDINVAVDFDGFAEVCIDYSDVHYGKETNLKLWHGEVDPGTGDSVWTNKTTTVDTVNNIICGEVSSFSWFAIVCEYDPVELVQALIARVEALNLVHGIENSLDAKLQRAEGALSDLNENNDVSAVNALEAFVNEVRAQRGDKIPEADADGLIADAEEIVYLLTHGSGGGQSLATPTVASKVFRLMQNRPNPLNQETTIRFVLPERTHVSLRVYDVSGRTVEVLLEEELGAGTHIADWRAEVPSGTYFYRMRAGDFTATRKMTVVR